MTSYNVCEGVQVVGTNPLIFSTGASQLTFTSSMSAARIYTFQDGGADSNVIISNGNQTINDTKTFTKNIIVGNSSFTGSAMGSTAVVDTFSVLTIKENFTLTGNVVKGLVIDIDTTASSGFSQSRGIQSTVQCSGS